MVVLKPGADPELKAFLRPFGKLFVRPENRFACQCYLLGLLSDRPRKNCDRMAEVVQGTSPPELAAVHHRYPLGSADHGRTAHRSHDRPGL